MKEALQKAEQDAKGRCSSEDVKQAVFAVVAFLDESVLSSGNPAFANWPRSPLQAELYGRQLAGEVFFQELQKVLNRRDSVESAELLEVYYLCLLLGFKGRYAAGGGDLNSLKKMIQERIGHVRGPSTALSPRGCLPSDAVRLTPADPWVRRLKIAAGVTLGVAVGSFVIFRLGLISCSSELFSLTKQLTKWGGEWLFTW